MSRKKRVDYQSSEIQNNPFDSLDIQFSPDQVNASLDEPAQSSKKEPDFPGGVVKVRLEKKGRGGKSVTVFYGFEKDQQGKEVSLLAGLKKALATGGKITEEGIELQGDLRKKSSQWLISQGYKVKGQIS
ncbi:MAG: hypothetical protein NE328_20915 [Lentisphaeraceae bacterium]|nr:hypothetical protein [Lentisphaeraceae bacterium]